MALIEEGGQWLENAYCTQLVPASAKSVKKFLSHCWHWIKFAPPGFGHIFFTSGRELRGRPRSSWWRRRPSDRATSTKAGEEASQTVGGHHRDRVHRPIFFSGTHNSIFLFRNFFCCVKVGVKYFHDAFETRVFPWCFWIPVNSRYRRLVRANSGLNPIFFLPSFPFIKL